MTPRAGCSEWPRSKRWIYHLIEQAARRPSARRFSLWVGAPAAAKLALAVLWMLAYASMTTAFLARDAPNKRVQGRFPACRRPNSSYLRKGICLRSSQFAPHPDDASDDVDVRMAVLSMCVGLLSKPAGAYSTGFFLDQ